MSYQSTVKRESVSNFRVFVASHKECNDIPYGYEIVQAGAAGKERFASLTDDSGDNISSRNFAYCELTVLYWIWKNIKANYIGFVHYRRFFYENSWSCSYSKIPKQDRLIEILGDGDILVAKPHHVGGKNVRHEYERFHHISDLLIAKSYIEQAYPEYVKSFDTFMEMDAMSYYNMFVAKEHVFHQYMEWVFPVLNYCFEHIDIDRYDSYNQRVIGFIAERLFNIWLIANSDSIVIRYMPVQQAYQHKVDIAMHTCKGLFSTLIGMR